MRHNNVNGKEKNVVSRASKNMKYLTTTTGFSPTDDELWSLKQVAGYLGISVDYARRVWVQWTDKGVNHIRLHGKPKGALRFSKSEIIALTNRWRRQQS